MSELSGTLAGVGTPAILRFLGDLEQSGRVRFWNSRWSGEVVLDRGRVAGAAFGAERGIDALEAIALALRHGQFAFASGDGAPPDGWSAGLPVDDLTERLARLEAESAALAPDGALLAAVPRPVAGAAQEATAPEPPATSVEPVLSLDRQALQVCLAINGHRTVEEVAAGYGLARTARLLGALVETGVLELVAPQTAQEPEPVATAQVLAGPTNGQGQPANVVVDASPPPSAGSGEHPLRYWLRPLVLAAVALVLLALTRWQAG